MIEEGEIDALDIQALIPSRDLATMQKWVEYNGVNCQTDEMNEESELARDLKALRKAQQEKIVHLDDIRKEVQN